jgi:hypothetical protein
MRRALIITLVVLECLWAVGEALAGLGGSSHHRRNRRHH